MRTKELIYYISSITEDGTQNWWYNTNDSKLYSVDELFQLYELEIIKQDEMFQRGFLPFLQVDYSQIQHRYLDTLNDRNLKKKLERLSNDDFRREFHRLVEGDGGVNAYARWDDFLDNELTNYLIEWCNSNNIKYSLK